MGSILIVAYTLACIVLELSRTVCLKLFCRLMLQLFEIFINENRPRIHEEMYKVKLYKRETLFPAYFELALIFTTFELYTR